MTRWIGILSVGFLGGLLAGFLIWSHPRRPPPEKLPDHFADAHLARLPFDGEWFVRWGGDEEAQNVPHHGRVNQNLALDLVQVAGADNHAFNGDPKKNESYLCWRKPIYSPAAGVVELVIDGIVDNTPGERVWDIAATSGNSVQIRSDDGFVLEFCHFQSGSVVVRKGDRVKPGDLLGSCGNSGNSTEPHLHFQVQSKPGFDQGVALRPVFDSLFVNGVLQKNHSPVKSEKIAEDKARGTR